MKGLVKVIKRIKDVRKEPIKCYLSYMFNLDKHNGAY